MPAIKDSAQWQLLVRILPFFNSDLAWTAANRQSKDEIVVADYAKLIKGELATIKVFARVEQVLDESIYDEFVTSTESLLSTLEVLLNDRILHPQVAIDDYAIDLRRRCPKLIALDRLAIPTSDFEQFVYLEQDAPSFKRVYFSIRTFIEAMPAPSNATTTGKRQASFDLSKPQLKSRIDQSFRAQASALLQSLIKQVERCEMENPNHRAMLQLDHRKCDIAPMPVVGQSEFRLLLSECQDNSNHNIWRQTDCTVSLTTNELYLKPNLDFEFTNIPADTDYRDEIPEDADQCQIDNLCQNAAIAHENDQLFRISLLNGELYDVSEAEIPDPGGTGTISLHDLFDRGILRNRYCFPPNDKKMLACTLAQALLNFYDSSWIEQVWTLKSISFLHSTDHKVCDVHRPYMACSIAADIASLKTLDESHKYPLIFSFGNLLLELETGEETQRKRNKKGRLSLWEALSQFCKTSSKHQLSHGYGKALEACVNFEKYHALELRDNPDTTEAEVILKYIVHQLEDDIHISDQKKSESRNLDLKMKDSGTLVPQSLSSAMPANTSFSNAAKFRGNTVQIPAHENLGGTAVMFDSLAGEEHAGVEKEFWNNHKVFYEEYIKPKAQMRGRHSRRIRIAVLDTGIDRYDSSVRGQIDAITDERWKRALEDIKRNRAGDKPKKDACSPIKEIKNFVEASSSTTDSCGHGTTMVGLLLRVAPDVDVYVAKVAESLQSADTAAVAKAIEWAVENEVDILSMSFGTRGLDSVIERALNNIPYPVIMFAAASNGGTGIPTAYPAFDYRVISVHALSGNGAEGSMNPTTEANSDAFGTLGYGVKTTWKDRTRFVNGTSYATPIAAGIVANYLEWVNHVAKDASLGVKEREAEQWKSKNTIHAVLRHLMSHRKHKLDFIMPWLLWQPKMKDPDKHVISTLRNHWRVSPSLE